MTPSLIGPLLAFIAILALIPLALWLLKRSPLGGRFGAAMGAPGSAAPVRLLGTLPLAPHQRLVTVEVGSGDDRRWLVLGVTPAGISALHSMVPPAGLPAMAPEGAALASPFSQLLASLRIGAGARDGR